jgi:hypothetical protein
MQIFCENTCIPERSVYNAGLQQTTRQQQGGKLKNLKFATGIPGA